MSEPVMIEARGAIEIVTLNRPDRLNAMDADLIAALDGYFRALCDRLDVRVVILRGAGRAFCAGLDLDPDASAGSADHARGPVQAGSRAKASSSACRSSPAAAGSNLAMPQTEEWSRWDVPKASFTKTSPSSAKRFVTR